MGDTAMTEGLTSGCTVHVLKRLRHGARMVVLESDMSLDNGSVWHAVLTSVGLPVPGATGVLNPVGPSSHCHEAVHQHVSLCWSLHVSHSLLRWVVTLPHPVFLWSLGWCLVPLVRPLLLKVQGFP